MPIKLPFAGRRDEQYPKDLWTQCPDCQEMLYNKTLDKGLARLPALRPPLPTARRRPTGPAARSRQLP